MTLQEQKLFVFLNDEIEKKKQKILTRSKD